MNNKNNQNAMAQLGTAIGVGLLAGLAGTIAMTVCQRIDMEITGRKGSDTPATAVREALDIKPVSESKTKELASRVHWVYGTSLGLMRGLMNLFGLNGMEATTLHFALVWATELVMLPSLRVAPPLTKEAPKAIAKDAMFHGIYAVGTGLVFDAIMNED
ncbi:MAG: hypothetical protein ACTHNG_04455 [Ginsengibacter sp.]